MDSKHERLRQVDVQLAAALRDVPVPQHLAARLLARLAEARAAEDVGEAAAGEARVAQCAEVGPAAPGSAVSLGRRISRRWLLLAAASLSVAASLFVAVWIGVRERSRYSESSALQEAIARFHAEEGAALQSGPPPADHPFSRDLLRLAGTRWRTIPQAFLGRGGVAYELPSRSGSRATLYVVRGTIAGLPVAPPAEPTFTTANCAAAAWQDGRLLYLFVVSGGKRAYRSYLGPAAGPVA